MVHHHVLATTAPLTAQLHVIVTVLQYVHFVAQHAQSAVAKTLAATLHYIVQSTSGLSAPQAQTPAAAVFSVYQHLTTII